MSQNQVPNNAQFPFLPHYLQPDAMRHRHPPGPPYHHQLMMREQYRNAPPAMAPNIIQQAQQFWILEVQRPKYFSIKKSKKAPQHSALQDYKDGAYPKEKEEFQAKKLEPDEEIGVNEYYLETQRIPQNNEVPPMYPLYSGKYSRDELNVPDHTIHRRRSRSPSKTAKGVQIWQLLPIKFPGGIKAPEIKHWVRDSEKENEYPFSRLNIKAQIVPCFTDEEWSTTIVFLPGSVASPQQFEKLCPQDQERHAIHESALSMQQIGWSYAETKRMWELLEQFQLRFLIVADRLDGPFDRSVDQVKDRYYRVARKLLEIRGDASNPLMRVPRFNYEHEVQRKKNLEMRLTWNSFEVAREEENLQTAKILNKQIKKEEKQIKSLQKLLKDETRGARHLGDLINIGSTLNLDDDYLSQNLGSQDSEDGSLSARRSKKRGGSIKNKRINRERDRYDNITPIMSPTTGGRGGRRDRGSGAYLRSQKLFMGLPVAEEENELIEKMLQEMEINKETLTPTERICNEYDTLRREILVYMQLKREIDAKKEELQQIERSKQEDQEAKQREMQMHTPPPLMQQGSSQAARRMSLARQNSDKMMAGMPPHYMPPPMMSRQPSGGNMEQFKRQHEMMMMQNAQMPPPIMGGIPGQLPNPMPNLPPGARMPPMMMPFPPPSHLPPNMPVPMPPESTSGGSPSIAGSAHIQLPTVPPLLSTRKSGTEGDPPGKKKTRK